MPDFSNSFSWLLITEIFGWFLIEQTNLAIKISFALFLPVNSFSQL